MPWRSLNLLAVQVYPSNTRPHYLERLGSEDGVLIRVGSTNRRADALQIDELKRPNRTSTFDEQAIPGLNSEALDFRAASEFFAPYRQLTPSAWNTLRVTTEHQGRAGAHHWGIAALRPGQVRTFSGCLNPGRPLCGDESGASPRFRGNPVSIASCCGRCRCIRPTASHARIDH
ncbi:hypothetical protein SBA3_80009 [Candidatus Sulfopaludibacter sp. SbA3]|nr:hypothetical protein SBA3_80009 [Candidatus Sulfopaludibacter sp. SbA3]